MAIDDAYVNAADYRAAVRMIATDEDTEILRQLKAVARWIERYTGRVFNKSGSADRFFDGDGSSWLSIDDLADLTALALDTDQTGTFDQSVTVASNVLKYPLNAATVSEPWTRLYLVEWTTNTEASVFPAARRSVKITGDWGWPAVPGPIVEASIQITRHLRDLQEGGSAFAIQAIDQTIRQSPNLPKLIDQLIGHYRREAAVGFTAV